MLTLAAALTNRNATETLQEGLAQLAHGDLSVDCGALTQIDSAAVAVLLGWQRAAQAQQRQLVIQRPPAQLLSLASVYGVAELLGFQTAALAANAATATVAH
jgi:phospholipid transport system transporter-binding protein